MRWWAFLIAWAIVMPVDAGLMPAFAVGSHVPQLWPVLLAFVALHASRASVWWSALAIGLWLDAAHPAAAVSGGGVAAVTVLGPNMLGCAAGAWGVMELRALLYRRNVLALVASAVACAWLSALAFVAIGGIRSLYADPVPIWGSGSGAAAVSSDLVTGLLSGLVGIVPAWLLERTNPAWHFATSGPRFGSPGRLPRPPR